MHTKSHLNAYKLEFICIQNYMQQRCDRQPIVRTMKTVPIPLLISVDKLMKIWSETC